jgi:phosphatidylglycerol:prolipoprotein diacylglycerol transferase
VIRHVETQVFNFQFKPHWHIFFDVLAMLLSAVVFKFQNFSRHASRSKKSFHESLYTDRYYQCLVVGAILGAFTLGSWNLSQMGGFRIGHSVIGALFGAILAIEIYKLSKNIRVSTGAPFALSICLGISVGRWGCFFAGLEDQTYGIATSLPWGVDFGDGVNRHPVQIYESLVCFVLFLLLLRLKKLDSDLFARTGFYIFILVYSVQRFVWEFLKPYEKLFLSFNIFHLTCVLLVVYAIVFLKRSKLAKEVS